MKGKHIIAGGLGNLGRHLQRILLSQGHSVRVLDLPRPDSANCVVHPSVEFVPFRLGYDSVDLLKESLDNAETVYSLVTPDVEKATVFEFQQSNHAGVRHLVNACKQARVPKLVFASSIAVTNHCIPSYEQDERHPLPTMDSYRSYYDITKRLGEDIVLQSNNNQKLRTCALRLGGILASPNDYNLRQSFQTGPESGTIYTVPGQQIDTLAASDIAKALALASDKLESDELPGQALFLSKCASGKAPHVNEITDYLGSVMDWKVQYLPSSLASVIRGFKFLQYNASKFNTHTEDLPGMPPHVFMDLVNYEKTFDNSKAYRVLDFRPELTWKEAIDKIVKDHRNGQQHQLD